MAIVGATGHRALKNVTAIESGVDTALRRIRESSPPAPLTVLSSLAEGADRLIARRALAVPGSSLKVPLPLPVADYVADFASADSRAEFEELFRRAAQVIELPRAVDRNSAYGAAGAWILERSDFLVAVWDGLSARGPGGTGGMVERARRLGLPLAWVHAGESGSGPGDVTFENFR